MTMTGMVGVQRNQGKKTGKGAPIVGDFSGYDRSTKDRFWEVRRGDEKAPVSRDPPVYVVGQQFFDARTTAVVALHADPAWLIKMMEEVQREAVGPGTIYWRNAAGEVQSAGTADYLGATHGTTDSRKRKSVARQGRRRH